MKRIIFILTDTLLYARLFAQTDSTNTTKAADTIRIGGMIIVKKGGGDDGRRHTTVTLGNRTRKHSNISTANWIGDLGFAN